MFKKIITVLGIFFIAGISVIVPLKRKKYVLAVVNFLMYVFLLIHGTTKLPLTYFVYNDFGLVFLLVLSAIFSISLIMTVICLFKKKPSLKLGVLEVLILMFCLTVFFSMDNKELRKLGSYHIPSGAMTPSVVIDDYVVSDNTVGLKSINHGDVIIFKYPKDEKFNYIMRVIAIEGDSISVKNGTVFLNKNKLNENIVDFSDQKLMQSLLYQNIVSKYSDNILIFEECITVNKCYYKLKQKNVKSMIPYEKNFDVITIPKGHVFVLGDNRNDSSDSRDWGMVPVENIVGKAVKIFWSKDPKKSLFEKGSIRWSRINREIN